MNYIPYSVLSQTSTGIAFQLNGLTPKSGVFVIYDVMTSVGQASPYGPCRYLVWHADSSTGGYVAINSTNIMNKSLSVDYTTLDFAYISFATFFEYKVLDIFTLKADMVSRRYPETFAKKWTISESMIWIEAALADINLWSPMTHFWYRFSEYAKENNININPYTINTGVPYELVELTAQGTLMQALVSQGLLEVDINFGWNDAGINVTYNNIDPIRGYISELAKKYEDTKTQCKRNYWKPYATGTLPVAAGGILGALGQLLNPLNAVGFPWFRSYTIGRPI